MVGGPRQNASVMDPNTTMASSSSFFTSSSTPMTKKTNKSRQVRPTLFQKQSSLKTKSLTKKQATVFKKAYELSTLCGIEVCVIYYGSDGELKTWPTDREKVKDMARRYSQLSDMKRRRKQVDLDEVLETNNKEKKFGSHYKYPDWDPRFDNCSVEQLTELIQSLERSQTTMQHRLRAVVESQMITTTTTTPPMNHLQQHSNQVSMELYNHGIGTLPQLPVSTSAFNQAQSLAPIPNSLTIYQNPNMETYSSLRGSQETGTNGFLSTSMVPYNSFNTNCGYPRQHSQNFGKVEDYSAFRGLQETGINNTNVEDYPRSLWAQGTGMNGLQNMDMYGYNSHSYDDNGFSHQLVQYPTQQRAAPVFQYMDYPTQDIRPLYEI